MYYYRITASSGTPHRIGEPYCEVRDRDNRVIGFWESKEKAEQHVADLIKRDNWMKYEAPYWDVNPYEEANYP